MGTGFQPSLASVRRVSPAASFSGVQHGARLARQGGARLTCGLFGAHQLAGHHVLRALRHLALEAVARAPQLKGYVT